MSLNFCECGCGAQAPPRRRFVQYHNVRVRKPRPENFWPRIEKPNGDDGCWLWTGGRDRDGYGRFGSTRAHRLAYTFSKGDIPRGMLVLHLCDTPPCCNPSHLMVGDTKENTRQALERGLMKGSSVKRTSKLTHEKARRIRVLYATGLWWQKDLARIFGVAEERVWAIVNGLAWKES